ncbi:alpha/beta fold hydrolase [Xanthobacter flavus]|uniref:alpha/beta fold hydrolase n=1 Tax=Xanthobacter flavus TaxID=281 RepID=UPI0037269DE2
MVTETTERHYRTDDGIELVADVGGASDAPAVILMHGGGQTRFSWAGAAKAFLQAGYQVVNYDARGHGASGWSPDGDYPLRRRALDLRAIADTVAAPVALVGASLGGATAMRAIADGFRPAALALVDIVPRPDPRGVQRIRDFMSANLDGFDHIDQVVDAIAAYNPHRPRPKDPSGLARNLRTGADGRLYWHWDPRILDQGTRQEMADFQQTMPGLADAVGLPVLLVRGADSDVVGSQGVEDLRAVLPSLEIFDVPGAGHMVAGDRNDAFVAGVLTFLKQHMPVAP